jgi:hypothetical protein
VHDNDGTEMSRRLQRELSPYAVYVTLLVVVAAVIGTAAVLYLRMPPPAETRSALPFPESQAEYYLLDDLAGHLHRPNVERVIDWPEHADGRIVLRTNNLGFREDLPTEIEKSVGRRRILITGDSHTDGVVANPESFPNRLEGLLDDAAGADAFEVLNGGTGHYGPHNYSGILERFLSLDLDEFVVVVYAGNDLLDAVAEAWLRGQIEIPERPPGYMERLQAARAVAEAEVSQGLNQILLLATFPELEERALAITVDILDHAARRCTEHRIGLTVVVLPSARDLPTTVSSREQAAAEALALPDGALGRNRELAERLVRGLSDRGIRVVDPYETMAASVDELYWRLDLHLNVAGHALLADLFFEHVAQGWLD